MSPINDRSLAVNYSPHRSTLSSFRWNKCIEKIDRRKTSEHRLNAINPYTSLSSTFQFRQASHEFDWRRTEFHRHHSPANLAIKSLKTLAIDHTQSGIISKAEMGGGAG